MGKQITYHVFMDSKDIQKILGNSLKELREAKGLTQEKLGECIGVEAGTIYRLESGKNFIRAKLWQNYVMHWMYIRVFSLLQGQQ